jgi:DNA-binding NarL/FixJ family response regulator
MSSKIINLAIVDDYTIFRKALKSFLSEQKDFNVVLQASDIHELLSRLNEVNVNVLIIDVLMPLLNSNEVIKTIHAEYPHLRILVLSGSTDLDMISALLDAGIHGYILKSEEPEKLLQAIHAVANGRIYRNRIFTESLYWNKQKNICSASIHSSIELSDREKAILRLIWDEKSNKEIAEELFMGIRSVEKIRQDMKEKLGVKSTVGLLKFAIGNLIIRSNIKMA